MRCHRNWIGAGRPIFSHCSTRGVHKATSRALVDPGATPREIMAITGYQTLEDPERYMDYGDSALNSRESFRALPP